MGFFVGVDGALRPRWLYFLGFLALTGQGRFLSVMLESLALTDTEIGIVQSLPRSLNSFMPLIWGILADRLLGRELTMCISVGTSAMAFGLLYFPQFQFFEAVLILRTLHGVLLSGFSPLLDSYCLAHCVPAADVPTADDAAERKKLYGRERLWGAISWALGSLLLGYLFDKYNTYMLMMPFYVGTVSFFLFVVALNSCMQRFTANRASYVQVSNEEVAKESREVELSETAAVTLAEVVVEDNASQLNHLHHSSRQQQQLEASSIKIDSRVAQEHEPAELLVPEDISLLGKLGLFSRTACCNIPNWMFFCTMAVASAGVALVENLSFLFFKDDIGASNIVLGISVCVTVSFEIPLFAVANQLVTRFSPPKLLFWGLIAYSVRVWAYTIIPPKHGVLVLLCEPLHGVTFALMQLAAVIIISDMAPPGLESFSQGAITAVRNLGTGFGLVVGGAVMDSYGAVVMYRGASIIVFIMALTYLAVSTACSTARVLHPHAAHGP